MGTEAILIGVAVLEPRTLIREALRALINSGAGMRVVLDSSSVEEILSASRERQLDVVLLAIDQQAPQALAWLEHLTALTERGRALVLTSGDDLYLNAKAIEL